MGDLRITGLFRHSGGRLSGLVSPAGTLKFAVEREGVQPFFSGSFTPATAVLERAAHNNGEIIFDTFAVGSEEVEKLGGEDRSGENMRLLLADRETAEAEIAGGGADPTPYRMSLLLRDMIERICQRMKDAAEVRDVRDAGKITPERELAYQTRLFEEIYGEFSDFPGTAYDLPGRHRKANIGNGQGLDVLYMTLHDKPDQSPFPWYCEPWTKIPFVVAELVDRELFQERTRFFGGSTLASNYRTSESGRVVEHDTVVAVARVRTDGGSETDMVTVADFSGYDLAQQVRANPALYEEHNVRPERPLVLTHNEGIMTFSDFVSGRPFIYISQDPPEQVCYALNAMPLAFDGPVGEPPWPAPQRQGPEP